MTDEAKVIIAVLIKNTIVLICFVALAIMFGKWWIALFSALYFTSFKESVDKENE